MYKILNRKYLMAWRNRTFYTKFKCICNSISVLPANKLFKCFNAFNVYDCSECQSIANVVCQLKVGTESTFPVSEKEILWKTNKNLNNIMHWMERRTYKEKRKHHTTHKNEKLKAVKTQIEQSEKEKVMRNKNIFYF